MQVKRKALRAQRAVLAVVNAYEPPPCQVDLDIEPRSPYRYRMLSEFHSYALYRR